MAYVVTPASTSRNWSRVVGVEPLARALGVHKATLFFWIKRGLVPPGRRVGQFRVWTTAEGEAIKERAETVRRRIRDLMPRICRGRDGWWACPACRAAVSHGNSPVQAQTHLRTCPVVWGSGTAVGNAPTSGGTERTLPLARPVLLELAADVVDGRRDLREFAAAVKQHRNRVRQIEDELRQLREEE